MADESLDLLIGDISIAKFLCGTPKKRRIVETLKKAGWPIFEIGGKNAARPSQLQAEVLERERAARANSDRQQDTS